MKTKTGLHIIHEGARVHVYTEREFKNKQEQLKWWKVALKSLLTIY